MYLPFEIEHNRIISFLYIELILNIFNPIIILWNTMMISLLMYVQCQIQILRYKIEHCSELCEENKKYIYLTQRVNEHLEIIRWL